MSQSLDSLSRDSLFLDPRTCALVIIDLQQGIMGMPLAPHSACDVLKNALSLADRLKRAGGIVIPVRVAFAADLADKPNQPVDQPMQVPPTGLPAQWSTLAPEIQALDADVIITKHNWSAFYGTELDLQLRRRGITTVILAGIASNFGVESTARDAWHGNYAVVVVEDACTTMGEELHTLAMERILPRIARVRSTGQVLAALG